MAHKGGSRLDLMWNAIPRQSTGSEMPRNPRYITWSRTTSTNSSASGTNATNGSTVCGATSRPVPSPRYRITIDFRAHFTKIAVFPAGNRWGFGKFGIFPRNLTLLPGAPRKQLPLMLQEAIALKYMQDMSYVEIAQKLGVPDGTVKSRVYRGPIPACMQIIETGLQSLTGGE